MYQFRRAIAFIVLLFLHLAFLAAFSTLVLFGTVPPHVHPENIGKVGERNCLIMTAVAFLVGVACYWNIQRFDRRIEK
jgi:hypothetical protein